MLEEVIDLDVEVLYTADRTNDRLAWFLTQLLLLSCLLLLAVERSVGGLAILVDYLALDLS